jgi:hypothetical protein
LVLGELLYLVVFYNQLWCFGSGGTLLSNHLRTFEVHAEKIHGLLHVEIGEENADVNARCQSLVESTHSVGCEKQDAWVILKSS